MALWNNFFVFVEPNLQLCIRKTNILSTALLLKFFGNFSYKFYVKQYDFEACFVMVMVTWKGAVLVPTAPQQVGDVRRKANGADDDGAGGGDVAISTLWQQLKILKKNIN